MGLLSRYIARSFLMNVAIVFFALLLVAMLLETVELLRRGGGREEATIGALLTMALLRAPFMAEKLAVFAVLFGAMLTFWRLTRANELVVARAAGVSAWRFLTPAALAAGAVGLFATMAFNPLSAATLERFAAMEAKVLRGQTEAIEVSREGLWLRQTDAGGQAVIHARRLAPGGLNLLDVTVFRFSANGVFLERLDAESGVLEANVWRFTRAWRVGPGRAPIFSERVDLQTELTQEKIQDSFAAPETMSFWELPGFIDLLENSGFSAHRHELQFNRLLAAPLFMAAMVLIAAGFSLRQHRRGGAAGLILGGVASGFLVYLVSDVVYALGLSNAAPPELAAWAPPTAALMAGSALLFHLEDG